MSGSERYDYGDKEDQFDKLVDQGYSPDRARRMLGIQATSLERPPESPLRPADHKPATGKAAATVQYGDNMRIETPDGRPLEDGPKPTQEVQKRTHHYTQNWREIGQQAIQDGTHETTDE